MDSAKFTNQDLAALFLRISLGVVFINAGWLKISSMEMVLGGFSAMGFNAFWAYLVTYVELIGGAALILGLGSRIFSVLLAIIMVVAMYVLSGNGFSLVNNGFEYCFALFGALAALFTLGSGKLGLIKRF